MYTWTGSSSLLAPLLW
uniref:Uncharacterized protein n=1 Tax=Arundo donax TaxID=35708 RepID=A0A0A8ZP81_ARUDO